MYAFIKKLTVIGLVIPLLLAACSGAPSSSDDGGGDPPGDGLDTTAPAAPGGFEGASGDRQIDLSWNANGESDLAGYNLYRSQNSFSDVSGMDPVNGSSLLTGTSYTDSGLDNGTTYYYRLTAVDDSGNESGVSSQVEVTPFSDPPDRP